MHTAVIAHETNSINGHTHTTPPFVYILIVYKYTLAHIAPDSMIN